MAKQRKDEKGLRQRGRRWWLRIYVSGQGKKDIPLVPKGHTQATTNKLEARMLATEIRRQYEEQTAPVGIPGLLEGFQAWKANITPKQLRFNRYVVLKFVKFAKVTDTRGISQEAIERYLARLDANESPKTTWNHKAALSKFCEFLVRRDILDRNPCKGLQRAKIKKTLPRYLTPDEYNHALRLAVQHGIFVELATALLTGLRCDELRRLAWQDLDFERHVLIVPESKSRRPRSLPMSPKLAAVLRMQQKRTGRSEYVFPGNQKGRIGQGMRGHNWWNTALRPLQAAIPKFGDLPGKSTGRGWHLARHTFCSRLAQKGIDLRKIQQWAGHASYATTLGYSHFAPQNQSDVDDIGKA